MKTLKKILDRQRRHHRIKQRISGNALRPRLVVSRSLSNHYVQLVDDEKGVTLASASDIKDKKNKDKKIDRAKKVGLEIAKIAAEKKIKKCVFDRNGYKFHGRVKAIAEGAREGGLEF
jgi:large subunit ribosomal protein L18